MLCRLAPQLSFPPSCGNLNGGLRINLLNNMTYQVIFFLVATIRLSSIDLASLSMVFHGWQLTVLKSNVFLWVSVSSWSCISKRLPRATLRSALPCFCCQLCRASWPHWGSRRSVASLMFSLRFCLRYVCGLFSSHSSGLSTESHLSSQKDLFVSALLSAFSFDE